MTKQLSVSDQLSIINHIILEHQKFREYVKVMGDSVTDREALASLQKARTDWVPGRLDILAETKEKLEQATAHLETGLKLHFDYEEEALPPMFGELFMQALILEHQQIMRKIADARTMIIKIKLEGLSREEVLAKESDIQQTINALGTAVEEHASREEVMLDMLQRSLQEKEKGQA